MFEPQNPKWWQTGVVYQIYPRSWADHNADGIGDFQGIIERLDYLSETLGINAIWLSPFYPSPMADFGYDVSDYTTVDPVFGSLADFDALLEAAHGRGLKVIVDYVINHSSDRHPWFIESRSSRDNPRRDWYIWRDPKPDGSPPNNWISNFGGPAWSFDEGTGQYYLHSFLPEQPDLNWRNAEVEAAMLDVLRFWLERGVDGFRIDVAQRAMKDPALRDNPPSDSTDGYKVEAEYGSQKHIFDMAHPDIHLLFKRLRSVVDEYEHIAPRFTIGEIHEYDWRVWGSYHGWELDELHMSYNFALLPAGLDPNRIRQAIAGVEASLPSGAWPNWVVGNHDEPRITERLGWEQSKVAAVLLLTLRGTPTIYYGDEIGMLQANIPAELQQDPWGRRKPGFGRDGSRTPMQWNPGPLAGFSSGASTWLPVVSADQINAASELGDPSSHLEIYRRLLAVRSSSKALTLGDISLDWVDRPLRYERRSGNEVITVIINLSGEPVEADASGKVMAGTHHDLWDQTVDGSITLRPWEGLVLG